MNIIHNLLKWLNANWEIPDMMESQTDSGYDYGTFPDTTSEDVLNAEVVMINAQHSDEL